MNASTMPPSFQERGARLLHFGTALGLGGLAALASSLPATVRIAPFVAKTEGLPRVWVALAASWLVPMVLAILILRSARQGLLDVFGPSDRLRLFGIGMWLGTLFVFLALFGSVLRATTHQHALAGVTYAFGAVALALGLGLFWMRVVALLRPASVATRACIALILALLVSIAIAWLTLKFVRAGVQDPASQAASAIVVDLLAFLVAALVAAGPTLASRRALALVGPPVAIVVAALGLSTLSDASLREAIAEGAPAFAPTANAVP